MEKVQGWLTSRGVLFTAAAAEICSDCTAIAGAYIPPPSILFCSIIALAATASMKETDSSVFNFDYTVTAITANVSLWVNE